eukprot:COSAG04_NODE_28621_length_274_cov_0.891429_1_plen_82_part_10
MFVGMLSARVCTTGVTKQVASPSSCKLDPPHCLDAGPRWKSDDDPAAGHGETRDAGILHEVWRWKSDDDGPAAGQCDGNCTH